MGAAQLFDGEEVDMPSKAAVGESQARVAGDLAAIDTSFGLAVRGTDGVYEWNMRAAKCCGSRRQTRA